MCWITAFNYYANTSMFGPNLPPRIRADRVDHLNRVRMAISSVKQALPQLHLLEITQYIMTNMSSLFYSGSHAPRDQLKDWLREEVRKDIHCAFNYSL